MKRTRMVFPMATACLLVACEPPDDPAASAFPTSPAAAMNASGLVAPSNAVAVAWGEKRIDLTWQDNSTSESGFEIHRSTTGEAGPFTLRGRTAPSVQAFTEKLLEAGTQYCYSVRAFRATGRRTDFSPFSNTTCATTSLPPPPPPPQPPSAASLTEVVVLDSITVRVAWQHSSSAGDGFRVYRSNDGGATWVLAGLTTNHTFVDSGVPNAELGVCYRVVAFNSVGDADPSNSGCTTPLVFAPTSLTGTRLDAQTVQFTWRDNSAVEETYEVWGTWEEITTCKTYPVCSDGLGYSWDYKLADLPANSTTFLCTSCASSPTLRFAVLTVFAKKGTLIASAELWYP